jgi:hypothetical protein
MISLHRESKRGKGEEEDVEEEEDRKGQCKTKRLKSKGTKRRFKSDLEEISNQEQFLGETISKRFRSVLEAILKQKHFLGVPHRRIDDLEAI